MTDDDYALLELAAEAAGYKTAMMDKGYDFLQLCVVDGAGFNNDEVWNPLDDDGDALRLAVKLRADITIGMSVKVTMTRLVNGVDDTKGAYFGRAVIAGKNDEEAVRRAIVCAAAEIGKEMQAAT